MAVFLGDWFILHARVGTMAHLIVSLCGLCGLCGHGGAGEAHMEFYDCTFVDNEADVDGAAVMVMRTAKFVDCDFVNNQVTHACKRINKAVYYM